MEKFNAVQYQGNIYVNVTPHPINFKNPENGEEFTVEPSGLLVNARPVEKIVKVEKEVTYVTTIFQGDGKGEEEIKQIREVYPEAIIIGSIITAQAYPQEVVALTPTPGYERVPVAEKRMNPKKFTTF